MTAIIYTRPPPPPPRASSYSHSATSFNNSASPSASSLSPSSSCLSSEGHQGQPRSYAMVAQEPPRLAAPLPYPHNAIAGPSTPPPASHPLRRRSRSRDIFPNSWRTFRSKAVTKDDTIDEPIPLAHQQSSISLTLPPSLPSCSLEAAFQCSDTNLDIPPAFYPGQAIPTILTFRLDRYSSLPHSLNPTLTMSLIGTLHLPDSPPRTIICVSVSLSEGLELWARDAQQAYATRVPSPNYPTVDPKLCLPGGTYSLPLTVQVPSTPRLPPSFTVSGASFAVTYALSITLTCDDPIGTGGRVHLAETARPFELMPETLPTRTPRYSPTSFWVRGERPTTAPESHRDRAISRRANTRWTVEPFLPTTAYSPTSLIPLKLRLFPPATPDAIQGGSSTVPKYQILIRLALVRREHSSLSPTNDMRDPSGQTGLIREVEIISKYGWVESTTSDMIEMSETLPLMSDSSWQHGFSTMLNVGTPPPPGTISMTNTESIAVSSTFHLATTLAFLPLPKADSNNIAWQSTLQDMVNGPLPPMGTFTEPTTKPPFDLVDLKRRFTGTVRTLPLPIVIGSVSEPRDAMQLIRWSDLHLERNTEGDEVGRVINGEALTCEDGWIQPPPSYVDAIATVPYEYK